MTSLTIHMGEAPPEGYFIAPGGSDSGAGTIGDPWQTLGKFYSVAGIRWHGRRGAGLVM